jgi:hypothetical protein
MEIAFGFAINYKTIVQAGSAFVEKRFSHDLLSVLVS